MPRIVALFVGGSSGIGRSTLRQLAMNADAPKVYIVGRNETSAAPLLKELSQINPRGSFNFVEADVSLMSNVDKACETVKKHEKALNLEPVVHDPGWAFLSRTARDKRRH